MAAIEGQATLTEQDYEEAWQVLSRFRRSPPVWWSVQASGLIGVTALAASMFAGNFGFLALALFPILVVVLPTTFLVFQSRKAFLVVPKRAFSEDANEALREMLQERLPTRPDQVPAFGGRPASRLGYVLWALLAASFLGIWHFLGMESPP